MEQNNNMSVSGKVPLFARAKAASVRMLLFMVMWWSITAAEPASWSIGLVACLLASALSLVWLPPQRLSLLATGQLLKYFLVQSLLGACDVASRVLSRTLRIEPAFITYRCQLRSDFARQLFMFLSNLLPGTLIADLQYSEHNHETVMTVHALANAEQVPQQLQHLEHKVNAVFCADAQAPRR